MSYRPPTTEAHVRRVPAWLYLLAALGIIVGLASFALGLSAPDPAPAWRALLINFLFWTSLAQGAFMWSVAFRLARTAWSGWANRLGHSAIWFLGVSVLIFVGLFVGRRYYLPWMHMDIGDQAIWLNAPFVFLRDGIGLLALFALGLVYVRTYLRQDLASPSQREENLPRTKRRLAVLGVMLAFVYTVVASLIGLDLAMSLVPQWYGTLFGWYYLIGGLYSGMAALIITTLLLRRWLGVATLIGRQRLQDMGNLLMAFAMAMTYFMFAQALTIWYENLPPETSWVLPRIHFPPWQTICWVLVFTCYLGVFALLVIREVKENPRALFGVAALVLLSVWLERYMLVAPSLAPKYTRFPVLVPLMGVGFLGLLVLTAAPFLARYPAVSPLDEELVKERAEWQ